LDFALRFPKEWRIKTFEDPYYHQQIIYRDEGDSWIILESNYIPCQVSWRRLYKNDPRIIK